MRHLSPQEFVEFLEGALAPARARHAESCETCRPRADELRHVMLEAAAVEAPEPSPLFWEHFSARVRAAIDREPAPRRAVAWRWGVAALSVGLASLVVLLVGQAVLRAPHRPRTAVAGRPATPAQDQVVAPADEAAEWQLVLTVADGLDLETLHEAAAVTLKTGATDQAVLQLSADERRELARLLASELERPRS